MWRKIPEPTQAQAESIEILKNETWLERPINFGEIIVDNGMKCRINEDNKLEAAVIDYNFIFEFQEDNSILFIVKDVFDKGWTSYYPLYLIYTDGEIEEL
jgi:mRNA-degrading endonuclease RelE of RelBE toxin-antitoxin system